MNLEAVTSSVLTALIKSSFTSVAQHASSAAKSAWAKIFADFSPYMTETFNRNRYVKILSQKDRDEYIYNIYVNSTFKNNNENVKEIKLLERINEGRNAIIVGNGGAGKTFFMRHLWLNIFTTNSRIIPIFIELRRLNEHKDFNLNKFICETISRGKLEIDIFEHFCNQGSFIFIFDGFDELSTDHKDTLQSQLLSFKSRFDQCTFVVSSRYDERFSGWQGFEIYESMPFNFNQVKSLIKKVPFERNAKALFSKQLTKDFYEEHSDFLSNPLLAIMMMMTFRENMEIPKRMNIFYDQAFNTLYQWHDSTKAYKRDKYLDIVEFQNSFSTFCLITYFDQKIEFTRSELISSIRQSSEINGISIPPEDILKDYKDAVNLMKQEGLLYTFIHRSFQEYFTALALTRLPRQQFGAAMKRIAGRRNDNVIMMTYEMNKALVLKEYIGELISLCRTASFFESNLSNFEYLEKTGVIYIIGIVRHDDQSQLQSLRLDMDPHIRDFLHFSLRLLDGNKYLYAGLEYNYLFTSDILQSFGKLCDGIDTPVQEVRKFSFRFVSGKLVISDYETGNLIQGFSATAEKELLDRISECAQIFRDAIGGFELRWNSEVSTVDSQTKTLEEILKLTE